MSMWTGKCDFADTCEMIHNPQEIVEKSTIYLGNARVFIKEPKDLIPYYTNLISMACYNKEDGDVIHLSQNSFIDREEREFISWKIRDVIYSFRKAKKAKVEFNYEYFAKNNYMLDKRDLVVYKAIIDKVNNNTDIAKVHLPKNYMNLVHFVDVWLYPNYFYDIHDSIHNRFREEFVKYASENGYMIYEKDENNKYVKCDGIYHPIIKKMCDSIIEYKDMCKKYNGD